MAVYTSAWLGRSTHCLYAAHVVWKHCCCMWNSHRDQSERGRGTLGKEHLWLKDVPNGYLSSVVDWMVHCEKLFNHFILSIQRCVHYNHLHILEMTRTIVLFLRAFSGLNMKYNRPIQSPNSNLVIKLFAIFITFHFVCLICLFY